MTKNKLCCRIFPFVLIIISALLNASIWYFDEGNREFGFFNKDEFFNYLGTTLVIAILPIALFYFLSEKDKYQDKARQISFFGFVPALVLLVFLIT